MAAVRASLPITGPRAATHEQAAVLKRRAQDALDSVNSAKRSAALKAAGTDTSRRNAELVKRKGNEPWAESRDSKPGAPTRTT